MNTTGIPIELMRWNVFTVQELFTLATALQHAGSTGGDFEWYKRCSDLHSQIVKYLISKDPQC